MMREPGWYIGCALLLTACGAGAASETQPAQSADDRLEASEQAPREVRAVPKATDSVKQGEAKLAANDPAAAKALFEAALASDPKDARAALDLGIALELLDDAKGAVAAYRRALDIDAQFAEALNNLGVLLRDRGSLEEAVSLLRRAAQANPSSAAAHQNLALAFEDSGDAKAADAEYTRALEIAPDDAMTRANHGLLLLQANDTAGALRELHRASADAQGNRAALLAVGNGLRRAGDAQGAVAAMQAAVKAGDGKPTPALLSELSLAQRAAGANDAARKSLEEALALDAKYAIAHYLLGNMLASDKRFAEAKQHYERYLKLDPKGEQAGRARERLAVIQKLK